MTEILKDCSNCEGSKYCITKPNKNDYKFPEEENQYLIDLECGIWDCHTAVSKLLKENAELKAHCKAVDEVNEKMKCCGNCLTYRKIKSGDITLTEQFLLKKEKCYRCDNYNKWELAE